MMWFIKENGRRLGIWDNLMDRCENPYRERGKGEDVQTHVGIVTRTINESWMR